MPVLFSFREGVRRHEGRLRRQTVARVKGRGSRVKGRERAVEGHGVLVPCGALTLRCLAAACGALRCIAAACVIVRWRGAIVRWRAGVVKIQITRNMKLEKSIFRLAQRSRTSKNTILSNFCLIRQKLLETCFFLGDQDIVSLTRQVHSLLPANLHDPLLKHERRQQPEKRQYLLSNSSGR